MATLHEDVCTFVITSRLFLVRMRNVPDDICREHKNTHFTFSDILPIIMPFWDDRLKCCWGGQATDNSLIWHMHAA